MKFKKWGENRRRGGGGGGGEKEEIREGKGEGRVRRKRGWGWGWGGRRRSLRGESWGRIGKNEGEVEVRKEEKEEEEGCLRKSFVEGYIFFDVV